MSQESAVGKVIERKRKRQKMSQLDLARHVGVSRVSISHTETGASILADPYIRAVAKALRLDEMYLLELASKSRGTLNIGDKPPNTQRLLCRIAHGTDLSPEAVAKIEAVLDLEQEVSPQPVAA